MQNQYMFLIDLIIWRHCTVLSVVSHTREKKQNKTNGWSTFNKLPDILC